MTEREYNDAEGIRRSDLWLIRESPEKYLWHTTHPDDEPTPALVFGAMVHKLMLEPETFRDEYVVAPFVDRRTKEGKAAWQEFLDSAEGRTVITAEDLSKAFDMVEAVKHHRIAGRLINGIGEHEKAFFWTDPDTGEKCKARVDVLTAGPDGLWAVIDYKTSADASTEAFNRSIFKYGYHLQSFMYSEAVRVNLGLKDRPDFIFVVQEKKAPYSVNVVKATEDVVRAGEDAFREYIGVLHNCKETGYWYGYNGAFDEINEAYLPGWIAVGDEEE